MTHRPTDKLVQQPVFYEKTCANYRVNSFNYRPTPQTLILLQVYIGLLMKREHSE